MPVRKQKIDTNTYYHIYNRAIDKQVIMHDDLDFQRFLITIFLANKVKPFSWYKIPNKYKGQKIIHILEEESSALPGGAENLCAIGAYAIMKNHFHFVVYEHTPGGVESFIRKLQSSYAQYYNHRYNRSGTLFQGRFEAKKITDDLGLEHVQTYVMLNPLDYENSTWREKEITLTNQEISFLKNYKYGSLSDFLPSLFSKNPILDTTYFIQQEKNTQTLLHTFWERRGENWELPE